MTKYEIEAFLATVHYGNISTAAKELYVTQPALSRRLINLEQKLGYPLFQRSKGNREIQLTAQGKEFLSVARKWNAVYREAMSIQSYQSKPTLHLATIGSVSSNILPGILQKITGENAEYNLDFHLCHSWEAYSLIEGGFSDLALIDYLKERDNYSVGTIRSFPVYSTPFVLLCGEDWTGNLSVNSKELDPSFEILLPWNLQFDLWHDQHIGISHSPRIRLDTSSVLNSVLHGSYYTILPKTEATALMQRNPSLSVHELTDGPGEEIVHVMTTDENLEKPAVSHFMNVLRDSLQAMDDIHCLY